MGEETNHDRIGKPIVCHDANHKQSMVNEVGIDFRTSGLPQSVAKQADNYRVRELVEKIENHPSTISSTRSTSSTTKKMIQDVGNLELFELFETAPETVQRMPVILE